MQPLPSHSTDTARRLDIYRPIHKALRAFMADTLVAVGRMDADDESDVGVTLEQARGLLAMLAVHLEDENRFVHSAMNSRRPGSAERTSRDHLDHELALAELAHAIRVVTDTTGAERAAAALDLYRRLALFVAENYEHMEVEERENNAVLWAHYTDAEIAAIEAKIVASVPAEAMAGAMRWMIRSLNHAERVGMLRGMRPGMPEEAFACLLSVAQSHLNPRDWDKLKGSLALA